jgi:hypothetical protein
MLLSIDKFGGIVPKIIDPSLLLPHKAQIAVNCRFDHGGVTPLQTDTNIHALSSSPAVQTIYVYYESGVKYYFTWATDVDAVKAPLSNDSFNRIFYAESGILKVTDNVLFNQGGTAYPMAYYYPCPPAPMDAPFISGTPSGTDPTLMETRGYVYTYVNGYGEEGPPSPVSNLLDIYDTNTVSIIGIGAVIDAYTKVLLHLDNNLTDTGATGHTVVNSSPGITFSNTIMKWGYSAYFEGTYAQLNIADHTDFDLSGGIWSFDEQIYYLPKATPKTLFYKASGANDYMTAYISGGFSPLYYGQVHFEIWESSSKVVELISANVPISAWNHIEITENGDSYYLLVNGVLSATASSSKRPAIYTGSFCLGSNGTSNFYKGYIDEVRLSKLIARHTNNFTPPTTPYADGTAENVDALYNVISKRIYRLNQSATNAQYQFVAEIPYSSTTLSDTIPDASLGEILASTEWDAAPTGIKGIIALPNGSLVGFVDNLLCFSVPKYPHAWPVSWQKATEKDIVALGAFGNTVVVTTEGQPYLAIGDDPSNVSMQRIDPGFSNMNKRGSVQAQEIFAFPCPEGLAVIGPNISTVLTLDLMIPQDPKNGTGWQDLYNPSTIIGFYWQGKYIGFYEASSSPLTYAGFMIDLKTGDLVDLDFVATAGYYDKTDGTLYLNISNKLVSFSNSGTYRDFEWKSKRFRFRKGTLKVMKVLASLPGGSDDLDVDIIYPKIPFTDVVAITGDDPTRIANAGLVDEVEARIYGNVEASALYLSSTHQELPV